MDIPGVEVPGQTEPISVHFLSVLSCKGTVKGKWTLLLRSVTIDAGRINLIGEYACNGVDLIIQTNLVHMKVAHQLDLSL